MLAYLSHRHAEFGHPHSGRFARVCAWRITLVGCANSPAVSAHAWTEVSARTVTYEARRRGIRRIARPGHFVWTVEGADWHPECDEISRGT